jgi:uncharacterized protein (TIGR02145 family)
MNYQWNRSAGWYDNAGTLTGALKGGGTTTSWDSSIPSGDEWESANAPSPAGWRVPTLAELRTLLDTAMVSREWTACNGVCGRLFTDKTTGKSLFLPAAGICNDGGNMVCGSAGSYGEYWSSTQHNSTYAYILFFYDGVADWSDGFRSDGFSVRCVSEF